MNAKHELELKEKNISKLLFEEGTMVCTEHYPGHPWSLVKLALLGQWAWVYTSILKKNWRGRIRYVDLLAGSGTTKIIETGDIVKGSPFVVEYFAYSPFDDYILIERDEERYTALKQNSKLLGKITEPIRGDCNKLVTQIFRDDSCHSLVFVDMEGFDLTWKNMEQIVKASSDIIVNFPTSSFERTAALENQHCLNDFFGDNSWATNALDREAFLRLYMRKLKLTFETSRNQTPYVESIRVGNRSYFYDMILVCKFGDYTNVWGGWMKERWNWQNPQQMKKLLDHLKGREPRLDDFFQTVRKNTS